MKFPKKVCTAIPHFSSFSNQIVISNACLVSILENGKPVLFKSCYALVSCTMIVVFTELCSELCRTLKSCLRYKSIL